MKWLLVAAIVIATIAGDLLQSHEMKRAGEQSVSAHGFAKILQTIAQRRLLILGVAGALIVLAGVVLVGGNGLLADANRR
jgi:putative NADH-flavin reductase